MKISMDLWHSDEIAIVAQALLDVTKTRKAREVAEAVMAANENLSRGVALTAEDPPVKALSPAKAAAAPAKKTAAKKPEPEPEQEPDLLGDDDTPATKDQMITALRDYVGRNGVAGAKSLLGQFGATKAGDLKPENYAALIKAAQA